MNSKAVTLLFILMVLIVGCSQEDQDLSVHVTTTNLDGDIQSTFEKDEEIGIRVFLKNSSSKEYEFGIAELCFPTIDQEFLRVFPADLNIELEGPPEASGCLIPAGTRKIAPYSEISISQQFWMHQLSEGSYRIAVTYHLSDETYTTNGYFQIK